MRRTAYWSITGDADIEKFGAKNLDQVPEMGQGIGRLAATMNRMVTGGVQGVAKLRTLRFHRNFLWLSIFVSTLVFSGFARTYFLHRWFGISDLSRFMYVHAVVMTSWIALFLVQTLLISAGRVNIHRTLGFIGIACAFLVVTFGVTATVMSAHREVAANSKEAPTFLVVFSEWQETE